MRPRALGPIATFAASGLAITGAFAAVALGLSRYATYQAESFGDRRLDRPTAVECEAARAVLPVLAARRVELLAKVGAPDWTLGLRAFAWRSPGPRAGGGADWRACRGLGPFVRRLGLARLNSGERGPMLYISRLGLGADGRDAAAWVALLPPAPPGVNAAPADAPRQLWEARFSQDPAGHGVRLIRLTPVQRMRMVTTPSAAPMAPSTSKVSPERLPSG